MAFGSRIVDPKFQCSRNYELNHSHRHPRPHFPFEFCATARYNILINGIKVPLDSLPPCGGGCLSREAKAGEGAKTK
mgnify:CR=1 FL=1